MLWNTRARTWVTRAPAKNRTSPIAAAIPRGRTPSSPIRSPAAPAPLRTASGPESGARYYARPGVTYRPVTGVSPSRVGVAWPPAADTNPVVQDFVRCCLDNKPLPEA